MNQYLNREIFKDIVEEEVVEETLTGTTEETTGTGVLEIISTEIMTEQEVLEEETSTGEILEEVEEIPELEGNLIYDLNGNLIGNMLNNKRQYIYSYDYKNRLVQIEKNIYKKVNGTETNELEQKTKIVEITYDPLGRRTSKMFNNGSYRKYYYSNQDIILEENYTKKHKLKNSKEFLYGTGVDDILSMNNIEHKTRRIEETYVNNKGKTKTRKIKENYTETNRYYYHQNHLGSIVAITDETASIVEEYAYSVFGTPFSKQLDGTITNLKKSKIGNTRLYTGREYDRGLKLYYNRARYYNPQLGRFISRDPIDIADDVNLYAYVENNSLVYTDRFGLEKLLATQFNSTALLLNYMLESRSELSFGGIFPKFGYSHIKYFEGSLSEKWNIKHNEDFLKLAYNPDTKKSCSGMSDTGGGGCITFIDGQKTQLSEIGNLLIGYNGMYAGFSLNSSMKLKVDDIYKSGMFVEYQLHNWRGIDRTKAEALSDELIDRPWYDAGYKLATSEIRERWGLQNESYSLSDVLPNK